MTLMDSSPLTLMDSSPRSRGAMRPRFARKSSRLEKRGRRECRMRAAPAVSCANLCKKNAHEHTGSAEALRHSLRNGLTAYSVLSPENRALLSPSSREYGFVRPVGLAKPPRDLTPTSEASGPHDFAVRLSIVRLARRAPLTENPPCEPTLRPIPPRPPHPIPTFGDDGQRPLLGDRMA